MRFVILAALASAAEAARYVVYFDQYHTTKLPDRSVTSGVTHVITAFAKTDLFNESPGGVYTPFMPLSQVRALFDPATKVCMAIGGWGDTTGFGIGSKTDTSRKLFAKNVADTVKRLGYDCVDVDWEYPGGNGEDYKQNPNEGKVFEIETYPLLLKEIKKAIGSKELSIAVPGLERDMIAYTAQSVPKINESVDFVNLMTYDLMNRRDTITTHHTSLVGSREAIKLYNSRGFPMSKMNIGFAFYAKWYTTKPGVTCTLARGCPVIPLEGPDGADLSTSGATTFEAQNFVPVPNNLNDSPDATCGPGTGFRCTANSCCGQYGFCGDSDGHCGAGCWHGYGRCEGPSILDSFKKALQNGQTDTRLGAQWYWDADTRLYWSWDTPDLILRKIAELAKPLGLGGIMSWSLAEDSQDWSHLRAMQTGFKTHFS